MFPQVHIERPAHCSLRIYVQTEQYIAEKRIWDAVMIH